MNRADSTAAQDTAHLTPGGPGFNRAGRQVRTSVIALSVSATLAAAAFGIAHWRHKDQQRARTAHLEAIRHALSRADYESATRSIEAARASGLSAADLAGFEAVLLARAGQIDAAEPLLIRALEQSSTPQPEVCEALARIYLQTYRMNEAAIVLNRWARGSPQDPKPWLWMTEIDRRSDNRIGTAVEHYRQALQRDPKLTEARRGLADALYLSNQLDESREAYNALLADVPTDLPGRVGRAQVLATLGEFDLALADLNFVLEQDPRHLDALRERAGIELSRGAADRALADLEAALSIDAYDAESLFRRARVLDRLGRTEEAAQDRARVQQLRDDQQALRKLQRAFNEKPTDALRCAIARWMLEHGQPREARRWALTVTERNPAHPEANRILAEYHEARGETGLANFHRLQAEGR